MVKLVDMPDLGSGAARRVGSSPIIRTEKASEKSEAFLFYRGFGFSSTSNTLKYSKNKSDRFLKPVRFTSGKPKK
jgi:hypothetical protein